VAGDEALLELHQRPHLKEVAKDEAHLRAEVLLELHQRPPHLKEVAEDEVLLKARFEIPEKFLPVAGTESSHVTSMSH
jgi:hypothetical protein